MDIVARAYLNVADVTSRSEISAGSDRTGVAVLWGADPRPGPAGVPEHPPDAAPSRRRDQKLAQYRAALDSGADPAVVGQWITETQARKLAADARLRAATGARPGPERMTKEQIAATINASSDLMHEARDHRRQGRDLRGPQPATDL